MSVFADRSLSVWEAKEVLRSLGYVIFHKSSLVSVETSIALDTRTPHEVRERYLRSVVAEKIGLWVAQSPLLSIGPPPSLDDGPDWGRVRESYRFSFFPAANEIHI